MSRGLSSIPRKRRTKMLRLKSHEECLRLLKGKGKENNAGDFNEKRMKMC